MQAAVDPVRAAVNHEFRAAGMGQMFAKIASGYETANGR